MARAVPYPPPPGVPARRNSALFSSARLTWREPSAEGSCMSSARPCCASGSPRLCYTASVRDAAAPLAGLVVLDLTRVLAGPYCTRLLADLGARVIKIERPGSGDEMRRAYLQLEDGRDDQSTYFVRCNVGKESVALDLGHVAAQRVMRDLARVSDVLVENFVPGVMARL